jgi:hypothetical protein
VFAIIDTASKTGTDNDGTAVTYFARDQYGGRHPLMILDWDIAQIEGALLETWLPMVFARLEELSQICQARFGSIGAMIEDKIPERSFCSKLFAGACRRTPLTPN